VDLIARRFRGVLIAIVVLGLSAGAVFAGHVVLQAPATTPTASEQGDQDEQAEETDNEAPEAADADEAETPEAPDAPETDVAGAPTDNHGALVSRAAQMETPVFTGAGAKQFANHGAFVSCVAHMTVPAGTAASTFDFTTVTPDFCAADQAARTAEKAAAKADRLHGKSGQHGKGHNRS
jgi:hypothetical protein